MKLIYVPNMITVLRIILVAPFLYYLLNYHYIAAFSLFFLAGISDGVDGYLARRFHWTTHFGTVADPIADKLLLVSSFFGLAILNNVAVEIMSLVVARDVFIIIGAGAYYYLQKRIDVQPSFVSKLNTFLQIAFVFLLLFELAFMHVPYKFTLLVLILMVATTLLSFIDYAWRWSIKIELRWHIGGWHMPKAFSVTALLIVVLSVTVGIAFLAYHYVYLLKQAYLISSVCTVGYC